MAEAGSFTNATVNEFKPISYKQTNSIFRTRIKCPIVERHARGLTLTENGEYVFKTAHEVISKLKVETSLGDQKHKPTGKLTITTVQVLELLVTPELRSL